jgi:hypothetical protein
MYCFCDEKKVVCLAPTHVAFTDAGGITAVDFNVGKSDRSGIKVTGKRKKAHSLLVLAFFYCITIKQFSLELSRWCEEIGNS